MNNFFKEPPETTERLLVLIAQRQWQESFYIIENKKELLLKHANVTDPAGRFFEEITPFQLALYNHDRLFWEKILMNLPEEEAARQFAQSKLETTTYVKVHGSYYDPTNLIAAYDNFIINYTQWSDEKNKEQLNASWCNDIGSEQHLLPKRWAAEYCRPNRSFVPTPAFENPPITECEVSLDDNTNKKISWFSPNDGEPIIGTDCAVLRAGRTDSAIAVAPTYFTTSGAVQIDREAINALFQASIKERAALSARLDKKTKLCVIL